jgi:hypothetical protein
MVSEQHKTVPTRLPGSPPRTLPGQAATPRTALPNSVGSGYQVRHNLSSADVASGAAE